MTNVETLVDQSQNLDCFRFVLEIMGNVVMVDRNFTLTFWIEKLWTLGKTTRDRHIIIDSQGILDRGVILEGDFQSSSDDLFFVLSNVGQF